MIKGALIGEGRTAEVFAWGENQVLKLFRREMTAMADHEWRVAQLVDRADVGAPAISPEMVELDGRKGVVYERIDGISMLHVILSQPWRVWQLAQQMAELHAAMHRQTSAELPALVDHLRYNIHHVPRLTEAAKARVLAYVETLPPGRAICHGDFHPDNIVFTAHGTVILDWMTACQGNPCGDVARTYLIFSSPMLPPNTSRFTEIVIQGLRRLWRDTYLKRYRALTGVTTEQIQAWVLPMAAARLNERIPEETDWLVTLIEAKLQTL